MLDIGCGVGKYGTYFAELGCGVTLTDISPAMLAHAARNMAAYAISWRIVEGDFAMLSTDELSGGDKFDLSVAMMSAAVHDTAGVEKMSTLTRGWCFTANFVEWAQPMRDEPPEQPGGRAEPREEALARASDIGAVLGDAVEAHPGKRREELLERLWVEVREA